eukprot:TRINITY_DN15376_c0_g1::TRINITY_DN15376_c0_g1_i1::g.22757::m.22757 TRINITY_DN15376_c0_g1::TRINITY_DN15376_c0_g1_i1::g.22757  ORF type:complete len:135 (+),score=3.59,zf-RING_UBOX/PF13445.1/0.077 TRINITY_DN15376_c0_g1_i1:56-460(+)
MATLRRITRDMLAEESRALARQAMAARGRPCLMNRPATEMGLPPAATESACPRPTYPLRKQYAATFWNSIEACRPKEAETCSASRTFPSMASCQHALSHSALWPLSTPRLPISHSPSSPHTTAPARHVVGASVA